MEEKLLLVGMLYKSALVIVVIQSCGVYLASAVSGTSLMVLLEVVFPLENHGK